MSPVHVIVGDDPRAEAMWSSAFAGAVDLYRFDRNVDAFERLTAAQAPIDLVVLTPAQRGPFNLTPDQFVARVLEGPLGASACLANLHVIVVGSPLGRQHPRAMAVSTLDAAIRLVKFGEVEHAPRPAAVAAPVVPTAPSRGTRSDGIDGLLDEFSGSIISRIWNAADEDQAAPSESARVEGGGPAPRQDAVVVPRIVEESPPVEAAPPATLFSRAAPAGFVASTAGAAATGTSASGATHAMPVGAPGESIEVATGLQPVRSYQLEGGGAYRGPAVRGGTVHGAGYDGGGQPVPPALASQVESMVYGGMQVGNPHDPVMVWSSAARGGAAAAPAGQPADRMAAAERVMASVAPPVQVPAAPMQPTVRTVPMEPPPGVYSPAPQPAAPQSTDPFLRRAEAGGGDVAFG